MKQNEITSGMQENKHEPCDEIGDNHISDSKDTPLREDAFALDDDTKIELIQKHFREIMFILGLDLTDDSLMGTPKRVAKMFVKETFSGLDPKNKPAITLFENKYKYNEMVMVRDITFYTVCEHHFVPFFGKAHVAYIPKGKVAGLSKINRLVQFFARRPQVQERLTTQIANEIRNVFDTEDVAVWLEAKHLCVASRGIEDTGSTTITSAFHGKLNCDEYKNQFLTAVRASEIS
ncbi:MAG: GTP cyclohydrolase I FolE [Chitinophagaceae bacterium]|nr:MAG: GTP cyclohydrolase I FolE [Chitinophagaceae bacterium]